jgi:hypothetical protein
MKFDRIERREIEMVKLRPAKEDAKKSEAERQEDLLVCHENSA